MIKKWLSRPLPGYCDPLKRGLKNAYILFSIASSIITIFTIEDWAQDVHMRVVDPKSDYARYHPVTEMDYLWIRGVIALLVLVLAAEILCRYFLKKGYLIHIIAAASALFWVLDTVQPFLLTYLDEPYVKEGTMGFFITLQILGHLAPGVFFGFASTSWCLLLLYCIEKVVGQLGRKYP